ncbi:MAG: GTPase HflX [Rickettsiales bacterium]|nr:GTPase HflX [Rickettsiales bacterium]
MAMHTLILHPDFRKKSVTRTTSALLSEAAGLAAAISLDVQGGFAVPIHAPRPSTLFGSGQIEHFGEFITQHEVGVVIVNSALSPVQQRNLEKAWNAKVIDRTALILEIFGDRARTHEGKLQVELAALEYQKSRLVRSWTHLERQRGGFGFLGGPGESQIELDRRMIRDRIAAIRKQLEKVTRTRSLHRKTRRDVPYPLVALVGYTNAGKSTLFNQLTEAETYAADALFATLDPVIRQVKLPSGMTIMLSDTVGFISDLPTQLIAAFRATLEEVLEADLLLHVRDASHPDADAQKADVDAVLKTLFGESFKDITQIEVLNKIDLLDEAAADAALHNKAQCGVSAQYGTGIELLREMIDSNVRNRFHQRRLYHLPLTAGRAMAWLHAHGEVLEQRQQDGLMRVSAALSATNIARFEREFSDDMHQILSDSQS